MQSTTSLAFIVVSALLAGCAPSPAPPPVPVPVDAPPPEPPPPPSWPDSSASLVMLPLPVARGARRPTIYLSAGHANAPGKDGNTGVLGQIEAEVNLQTLNGLADHLEATGRFEVVRARQGDERPSYTRRVEHAAAAGADVFIELHTDSRGDTYPYRTLDDGTWLYRADGDVGFSVLYRGSGALRADREQLARVLSEKLAAAGFPPYPGCHYEGLYDHGPVPGSFIDRRGLFLLRKPTMASVIIETHNAKDVGASERWTEARTHEAFHRAVAGALTELLFPET